jgi:hypothetical protein
MYVFKLLHLFNYRNYVVADEKLLRLLRLNRFATKTNF